MTESDVIKSPLSRNQTAVILALADGLPTNKEIAQKTDLTLSQIRQTMTDLYQQLEIATNQGSRTNRQKLLQKAQEQRFVHPDQIRLTHPIFRHPRKIKVLELLDQGLSPNEICSKTGLKDLYQIFTSTLENNGQSGIYELLEIPPNKNNPERRQAALEAARTLGILKPKS